MMMVFGIMAQAVQQYIIVQNQTAQASQKLLIAVQVKNLLHLEIAQNSLMANPAEIVLTATMRLTLSINALVNIPAKKMVVTVSAL